MKPIPDLVTNDNRFWAEIKFLSQKIGYSSRGEITFPEKEILIQQFEQEGFHVSYDSIGKIHSYLKTRADCLNEFAKPNLMNAEQAEQVYHQIINSYTPKCPLPLNKQKDEKKAPAYFTCIINMLIEKELNGLNCDFDPKFVPFFTKENSLTGSLSRRVDGCFPSVNNPIALWEIKEYYYTTTFGSRIADGVYETQLDGFELKDIRSQSNLYVGHYLMIDAYDTRWLKGKSYLCRIFDMLHQGLVSEVLIGREVLTEMPRLVKDWVSLLER